MRKIKDFFYNFSDIIFVALVVAGIIYVLNYNIEYITNIEAQSVSNIVVEETNNESSITEINVTLPTDIDLKQLSSILLEYEVISDSQSFLDSFNDKNVKIKSGDFTLIKNMDFNAIKNIVIENKE